MALLKPSKETQKKLRWSTHVEEDDASFQLYIPKWRVPQPWPGLIRVRIEAYQGDPTDFEESPHSKERLEDPIRVLVRRVAKHSRTVRFAPVGNIESWQIGQPYIPLSLVVGDSDLLAIEVEWDLSSKGQFVGVPTYRQELRLLWRG